MRFFKFFLILIFLILIAGCSEKNIVSIYNKPAIFWYEKIIKEIKNQDLGKADDYFTSLSSEHVESPLLPTSMLILANAHIEQEEYILANFYLDEYIKRYGDIKNSQYAKFLKIKANFESFSNPNRNQQLIIDTIKSTKDYLLEYPDSQYNPMVKTILTKLELANLEMTQEIAMLYKRIDKPKASKIYEERVKASSLKDVNMIKPHIPWYRAWFE